MDILYVYSFLIKVSIGIEDQISLFRMKKNLIKCERQIEKINLTNIFKIEPICFDVIEKNNNKNPNMAIVKDNFIAVGGKNFILVKEKPMGSIRIITGNMTTLNNLEKILFSSSGSYIIASDPEKISLFKSKDEGNIFPMASFRKESWLNQNYSVIENLDSLMFVSEDKKNTIKAPFK